MKVIISFSVDEHLVDRLKLACYQARISFSQYAEFALRAAPPVTEDLAVRLSRERRGLPTPVARPEAPVEPPTADPEAAV